jgi:hypothetical protein
MPGEAGKLTCVRCGLDVRVNRDSYEIFERMHYVCFHYVFEHGTFDPDEECDAGGCPSARHGTCHPPETGPPASANVARGAGPRGAQQRAARTSGGSGG